MSKTAGSSTGWVEGKNSLFVLNLDVYFLFLTLKPHLVPPMLFSLLNEKLPNPPRLVIFFFLLS
jgi:hypothetical protein